MNRITIQSPAKINLHLEVLGKRPDGYHDLRMVMTRISLFDEVAISLKDQGISLWCDNPSVPTGEKNIAWQAAGRFMEEVELECGLHIEIKKSIPVGGGLGGGSSNAASVLMGLNKLTGQKIGDKRLMEIGLALGADIPFFIFKGPAIAEGIGEKLTMADDLPKLWLVLVNPNIEVSTASIFKSLSLELTKPAKNLTITGFNHSLSKVISILHNDLETVAMKNHPEISAVKDALKRYGRAEGVLMSGSGATVFGIYRDKEGAENAIVLLNDEYASRGWTTFLAESI